MIRTVNRAILASSLILLAAAGAWAQEASAVAPLIAVDEPVFDAGLVPKGDKVVHVFKVRNTGDAELEITSVKPTCGCTVASFDGTVPPGGEGKITAELDTTSFTGPISKTIVVTTNDTATPQLQLTIKVEVRPFVSVTPGYARFITYQGADPGTVSQTVWADDHPDDFEVTAVKSPYPFIQVSFHEAKEDERKPDVKGRQWIVSAALGSEPPVGALTGHMAIETNHPKQKKAMIPVSGFVRPMIFVSPEVADFGSLESGTPREVNLDVRNFAEEVIKILEVQGLPEGMEAAILEVGKDEHRFQVTLKATPEMKKGRFDGTVQLKTSSEEKPLIEVPLRGVVD